MGVVRTVAVESSVGDAFQKVALAVEQKRSRVDMQQCLYMIKNKIRHEPHIHASCRRQADLAQSQQPFVVRVHLLEELGIRNGLRSLVRQGFEQR